MNVPEEGGGRREGRGWRAIERGDERGEGARRVRRGGRAKIGGGEKGKDSRD